VDERLLDRKYTFFFPALQVQDHGLLTGFISVQKEKLAMIDQTNVNVLTSVEMDELLGRNKFS